MQISYTADAFASLIRLVNFIEASNTSGAGLRWLSRYQRFLEKTLLDPLRIKLCNNQETKPSLCLFQ